MDVIVLLYTLNVRNKSCKKYITKITHRLKKSMIWVKISRMEIRV